MVKIQQFFELKKNLVNFGPFWEKKTCVNANGPFFHKMAKIHHIKKTFGP
jgi:hypothetical protein